MHAEQALPTECEKFPRKLSVPAILVLRHPDHRVSTFAKNGVGYVA